MQPARARAQAPPPSGASSPVPAARLRRVTDGSTNGDDDRGEDGGGGGSGGDGGADQVGQENGLAGIKWRAVASRGKEAWVVVCNKCLRGDVR